MEGGDFASAPSSSRNKLRGLFGGGGGGGDEGSVSFKYQPPKMPGAVGSSAVVAASASQTSESAAAPATSDDSAMAVVMASPVQLFTFDATSQTQVPRGQAGLALLQSATAGQLLVYDGRKVPLATATIAPHFSFTVQSGVYGTFYDSNRVCCSVLFATEADCANFARAVSAAVAKFGGATASPVSAKSDVNGTTPSGSNTNVFVQNGVSVREIVVGTGNNVAAGDSVMVEYKGWLRENDGKRGTQFDSNAGTGKGFKFTIGEGKVIKGWDVGVVGMKKGGRRELTVPPHLAYGSGGSPPKIPPYATLIFEVEVMRIKWHDNKHSTSSSFKDCRQQHYV